VRPTSNEGSLPQLPPSRSDVVPEEDADAPATTQVKKPGDPSNAASASTAKKPAKALKLDPKLLERVLQGRNAGQ
jgi:hypothetical protein